MLKLVLLVGVILSSIISSAEPPKRSKSLSALLNNYFRGVIATLPKEDRQIPVQAKSILDQLDSNFSPDIEIILSYGTVNTKQFIAFGTNPFGHIAIRIDGTVYTINGLALKGQDSKIIEDGSLFSYLYGLEAPTKNVFHGDAYGNSYIQPSVSLRIRGVSMEKKEKMIAYIKSINAKFNDDFFEFKYAEFNCSSFVFNVLKAGSLIPEKLPFGIWRSKVQPIKMPLDVFSMATGIFQKDSKFETQIVLYPQISQPNQLITGFKFPITFFRPIEMIKTLFSFKKPSHRLETLTDILVEYDNETKTLSSRNQNAPSCAKALSH